jgi:hypothetical protein
MSRPRPTGSILADSDRTTGGYPHIPVTRIVCEASKRHVCSSSPIPIRSHAACPFHMTTGGIDDESPEASNRLPLLFLSILCIRSWADVSTWLMTQTPMSACHYPIHTCLSAFEHPQRIASLWLGSPGFHWAIFLSLGWHLASFQAWKSRKIPRNADTSILLHGK